jgi:hypothetical protein
VGVALESVGAERAGDFVSSLDKRRLARDRALSSACRADVTPLAGVGNDSRFLQISVPVQPGNSGGRFLTETAMWLASWWRSSAQSALPL